MHLPAKFATAAAATAALTMGLTAVAPAASAAPATASSAPACISRTVIESDPSDPGFDVYLYNGCSGARYVQVIIDYGPDSGCYYMPKGSSRTVSYRGLLGVYNSTVLC
ncbi:hypothetical protein GCM10010451_08160 [Streptomyces virens]|uniref:Beta-Ig-H3/fasciclin n=2 Tax=Streptomyces TaxID=1883 RepID=A0A514JU35_9ACTN|nr:MULTISPECIES: beta-Ig-H3/fasciclin [Streptomyces]MBA8978133.1 hypothetical protein [Streptomyces calvus]MYS29898.1 beta-Ig-H3/fasciclin [Streptomyces sp. SID7804]QDI70887.1 beta-Ig-H3/fasciclin [Streptomyces calvus]